MTERSGVVLTVLTALGCGVVSGVFFAFSAFVMKALVRLPRPQGMAAMQSINAAAPTPWFMVVFLGTAAGCVALAVSALLGWDEPAAVFQVAGSALYLVAVVLTVGYHVPRNNALATVDPNSAAAAGHWAGYVAGWTAWNHVRTAVSLAAAAMLVCSLRVG